MDKKEVHQKALGTLRYLKSHVHKKDALDKISETFHAFIKSFYDIEHEHTKEELAHILSKKKVKYKEELLALIERLDGLKYRTDTFSCDELKWLLNDIVEHIKRIEVHTNEKKSIFKKIFRKE